MRSSAATRRLAPLAALATLSTVALARPAPAQCPLDRLAQPGGADFDGFGASVALWGDWLAVGAPGDDAAAQDAGAVQLYELAGSRWEPRAKLTPLAYHGDGRFGSALALAPALLAVGAPRASSEGSGLGVGRVVAYERTASGWIDAGSVGPPESAGTTFYGAAVATDGELLVVGAPYGGTAALTGAIWTYERASGGWLALARIESPSPWPGNEFGCALALTPHYLAVGARGDSSAAPVGGAVYVYARTAGGLVYETTLVASGELLALARFGSSLAADGAALLVGAPGQIFMDLPLGAAHAFERTASGWVGGATLVASDATSGELFGLAVALDGERAAIGAPGDSALGAIGEVHAYRRDAGAWAWDGPLRAWGTPAADGFGAAVALRSETLVVGARYASEVGAPGGAAFVWGTTGTGCLAADVGALSLVEGGTQVLELDAGPEHALRPYLLLGTLTGTWPGIVLEGARLPLNPDGYGVARLYAPNAPPLEGNAGMLDALGRAQAKLVLPPGSPAALAGYTLSHAYLVVDPTPGLVRIAQMSHAVDLRLDP